MYVLSFGFYAHEISSEIGIEEFLEEANIFPDRLFLLDDLGFFNVLYFILFLLDMSHDMVVPNHEQLAHGHH